MLHVLPTEVTLNVLSHLPIPSLLSLPVLSRQWLDFFTTNQSEIFHNAALLHEYIKPETLSLEDGLSVNTGRPWAGSTAAGQAWAVSLISGTSLGLTDHSHCEGHRSFQLHKNWEGKGRAVARVLSPPGSNVHRIKVDEKAGICISTNMFGGISVIHLFSSTILWCLPQSYVRPFAHCEYDNGYLVFDRMSGEKEVWRLASDFSTEGEVATHSPPDGEQMDTSAYAATVYHQYAPRGQFRPWAVLALPSFTTMYRLAYPTLICANSRHAFLYDVRTGSLVQTIDIHIQSICYIDVDETHAFVCEPDAVHVFSRESGNQVLEIPADATVRCNLLVEGPISDKFITPLSVSPKRDKSRPRFIAAHVSRDGRDLVVLSHKRRVVFIRDFKRICRGEISLERGGLSLNIRSQDVCCYLGFEHGRVCVATMQGLYIFTFGPDLSAKAAFVRPSKNVSTDSHQISCMQLTDRHIYFTWEDARRRQDIPLFEDAENAQELPSPITPTLDQEFQVPPWIERLGEYSFTEIVPLGTDFVSVSS
ncbi:hypothetical protein EDB86DRAFT_3133123 [Lactarius hatsudake]|nr:hypothetical protein EDB86DRAFT_3133123 [Lactarius hatsudake]